MSLFPSFICVKNMKVRNVDLINSKMDVIFDFWEIELLGFDLIKYEIKKDDFFNFLIEQIKKETIKYFSAAETFGIKPVIDYKNALYICKVKPINERINEFVFEQMKENDCSLYYSGGRIWIDYIDE